LESGVPNYQGKLDGLCGMYALSNALEVCGVEDYEKAWDVACEAIPSDRWPQVLWEGTTFDDLNVMIEQVRVRVKGAKGFHYCTPSVDDQRRTSNSRETIFVHS